MLVCLFSHFFLSCPPNSSNKVNQEFRLNNLFWFLAGGRLSNELKYLKKFYDKDGINSDTEVMIQINKERNSNILNVKALKEHLEMMNRVVSMEIYVYQE